jgi:hypothetical protein
MAGLIITAALVGVGYVVGSGYVRVGKRKRNPNPSPNPWAKYRGGR